MEASRKLTAKHVAEAIMLGNPLVFSLEQLMSSLRRLEARADTDRLGRYIYYFGPSIREWNDADANRELDIATARVRSANAQKSCEAVTSHVEATQMGHYPA
jgi:hypothetical protein